MKTEEEILREDHENGECIGGCQWCFDEHQEIINARYEPTGFYASRYMTIEFKA